MSNGLQAPRHPPHPPLPPATQRRHLRRRHPPTQRCRPPPCLPRPLRAGAGRTAGGAGTGGVGGTDTDSKDSEDEDILSKIRAVAQHIEKIVSLSKDDRKTIRYGSDHARHILKYS